MIIITLIYYFMDAKTFYRIIFVGNEPYKNRRKELNDLKRDLHQQLGVELQEDDYLNIAMSKDLVDSMDFYVRKSISGVFKILTFKRHSMNNCNGFGQLQKYPGSEPNLYGGYTHGP